MGGQIKEDLESQAEEFGLEAGQRDNVTFLQRELELEEDEFGHVPTTLI